MPTSSVTLLNGDTQWQVPPGVTKGTIRIWRGGYRGGAARDNGDGTFNQGGGAAGSPCLVLVDVPLTPGEILSVAVGIAGSHEEFGTALGGDSSISGLSFSATLSAAFGSGFGYTNDTAGTFGDAVVSKVAGGGGYQNTAMVWTDDGGLPSGGFYSVHFDTQATIYLYPTVADWVAAWNFTGDSSGMGSDSVLLLDYGDGTYVTPAVVTRNMITSPNWSSNWFQTAINSSTLISVGAPAYIFVNADAAPGGICDITSFTVAGTSGDISAGQNGGDGIFPDDNGTSSGGTKPDGGDAANGGGAGAKWIADGNWTHATAAIPGGGGLGDATWGGEAVLLGDVRGGNGAIQIDYAPASTGGGQGSFSDDGLALAL